MPNWIWMLLVQIILILLNAIFAGSEIAVLSVNEFKLNKMIEEKNQRAIKLKKLTEDPSRFLSTIQIAITLSGFLGSAFAADGFAEYLTAWMESWHLGISSDVLNTISVIIITLILSYFTLVFGELVPKQIAIHRSEKMALSVSSLITAISVFFSPLVKLLTVSANAVLRLFGIQAGAEEKEVSEEEIMMMAQAGTLSGTIEPEESDFISNVFAFNDLETRDLMLHRTQMEMIHQNVSDDEIMKQILSSTRSLLPVVAENSDDIVGVLNTKKFFRMNGTLEEKLKASMEPPYFVFESMNAQDLFDNMKKDRQSLAIVLDEYGGVSGLITLNDLIEQLVGDLEEDEKEIEQTGKSCWKVLGRASLLDVNKAIGSHFDPDLLSLNGLVYHLMEGVPENGSHPKIVSDGYEIILDQVVNHRVESATICKRDARPAEDDLTNRKEKAD